MEDLRTSLDDSTVISVLTGEEDGCSSIESSTSSMQDMAIRGDHLPVNTLSPSTLVESNVASTALGMTAPDQSVCAPSLSDVDVGLPTVITGTPSKTSTPPTANIDPISKTVHQLKYITWKKCKVPIVTQNANGPCPLIAIANVLLLRGKISFPLQSQAISADQLMEYIADAILDNVPKNLPDTNLLNFEQNMHDAIAVMPRLHTGLDVNVKFTGVQDFEYTPECTVFDLLDIPLYHGWLVDPQARDIVAAIGSLGYNQLIDKIIVNKCSDKPDLVTEALIAEQFLEGTASQMTYHGLCELNTTMNHDELGVLFRNNHFSTILKKGEVINVDKPMSESSQTPQTTLNELFQLVTDQGFLREPHVVWETIINIEGDSMFVDSLFKTVPPIATSSFVPTSVAVTEEQQINQDFLVALSLQEDQKKQSDKEQAWEEFKQTLPNSNKITSDAELARSLHDAEQRRASASPSTAAAGDSSPSRPTSQASSPERKKSSRCFIL